MVEAAVREGAEKRETKVALNARLIAIVFQSVPVHISKPCMCARACVCLRARACMYLSNPKSFLNLSNNRVEIENSSSSYNNRNHTRSKHRGRNHFLGVVTDSPIRRGGDGSLGSSTRGEGKKSSG